MNDFVLNFKNPKSDYSLAIDVDERVAYAYLKDAEKIVGDVWLFNRNETPEDPEWHDRSKAPFRNCAKYVRSNGCLDFEVKPGDVTVRWLVENRNVAVEIYVQQTLVARLAAGQKPGSALLAAKDGPLAKALR